MGRTTRLHNSDNRPHVPKITRVELSENGSKIKVIAVVIFIVIAAVAFSIAIAGLLSKDPGWREVKLSSAPGSDVSHELSFQYEIGHAGIPVNIEYRQLTEAYTELCTAATNMFGSGGELLQISKKCGEALTVSPELYDALALMQRHQSRAIYLAPVYSMYSGVCASHTDAEAAELDPAIAPDAEQFAAAVAGFAADPSHIELELLGDCRLRLNVSQEYADYAKASGVESFLDFGWMKNAFALDYIADGLIARGFTRGAISSYDGFVRCLDSRSTPYSLNLFDREDALISRAAVMHYAGTMAIVSLRDYPLDGLDVLRYYEYADGSIRTPYIDTDALCRSSIHELIGFSAQQSCGEIALRLAPIYIAESFDADALLALKDSGIDSIFCVDRCISHTVAALELTELREGYRTSLLK